MRTVIRNSYTPKTGDYCNKIVIDEANGAQYIFDSDGVFSTYTSKQQEGAPLFYVDGKFDSAVAEAKSYADAQDQIILQAAKDYTDQHGGGGDVTKAYVDDQDTATLNSAKAYADAQDVVTLTTAQGNADAAIVAAINEATDTLEGEISSAVSTAIGNLATVATTGSYSDLSNKPTVPIITMTTTDPGEGATLAANTFVGVYQ